MSFADLFDHVTGRSAVELARFMENHHSDDYQLVDVRQPGEFAHRHLPGAISVPADELSHRAAELDPGRPVILYCNRGSRSRAAGQVLLRIGFKKVSYLKGGLAGWHGQSAGSLPELSTTLKDQTQDPLEQAVLAWHLEENTCKLYAALAEQLRETAAAALFVELAAAETEHKAMLLAIWEGLAGRPAPDNFPDGLTDHDVGGILEGGMRLDEALAWARLRQPGEILELAMALEDNAYDHYLSLKRSAADENSRRLFELVADEELRHLRALGEALTRLSPSES